MKSSDVSRLSQGHWWINANKTAKSQYFFDVSIGDVVTFKSFYRVNDTPRKDLEKFKKAQKGDLFFGYVTKPFNEIVAIFEVTRPLYGPEKDEAIEFKKISQLRNPIRWAELRTKVAAGDWEVPDQGRRLWPMTDGIALAIRAILGWHNPSADQSATNSASSSPSIAADDLQSPHAIDDRETERDEVRTGRIGQDKFRQALIDYWGVCAVTGCSSQRILRASHIQPWSESESSERLDHFNGLLLAPHFDALFDAGLISFDESGQILVSPELSSDDRRRLGVHESLRLRKLDERHKSYLCGHRKKHGFEQ